MKKPHADEFTGEAVRIPHLKQSKHPEVDSHLASGSRMRGERVKLGLCTCGAVAFPGVWRRRRKHRAFSFRLSGFQRPRATV